MSEHLAGRHDGDGPSWSDGDDRRPPAGCGGVGRALPGTAACRPVEDRLRQALVTHEALVHELQHRLRNNLAVVASVLALQASRAGTADAGALLRRSAERVRRLAVIQDLAYASFAGGCVDVDRFVAGLAADLLPPDGPIAVAVRLATGGRLPLGSALTLGLIVSEALANIAAHAHPAGSRGHARVEGGPSGETAWIAVADDGAGVADGAEHGLGPSLGFMLMRQLTGQLGGRMTVERARGTRVVFTLPLPQIPPPSA